MSGAISAYGVRFRIGFETPAPMSACTGDEEVHAEMTSSRAVRQAWSGPSREPIWTTTFSDGAAYQVEFGTGGDYLFTYADRAMFHLSSRLDRLRCAPEGASAVHWQRVLLDDVLHGVSALRGNALIHCSAVDPGGGIVAFAGPTGSGKTSLALEMLRRGAVLTCDDVLAVSSGQGSVIGYPGPAVMNVPSAAFAPHPRKPGLSVIADFPQDDEGWARVSPAASAPSRVAALFLLERDQEHQTELGQISATLLDVVPFGIGFGHTPFHAAARFQTFADLAENVDVYRLKVGRRSPPAALADLVYAASPISRAIDGRLSA